MKRNKKGQVAVLDLFMSGLMFGIAITLVMFTWNSYNVKIEDQLDYNTNLIKAYHVSDLLVKYPGRPTGWHRYNTSNPAVTIGLAQEEGVLNIDKVDAFVNNLTYNYTKDKLEINNYEYFMRIVKLDETNFTPPLSKGNTSSTEQMITLRRYVLYNDEEAILEFTLKK